MKFHLRDTNDVHIKCVLFAHRIIDIDETHALTYTHTHIYAYGILFRQGPTLIQMNEYVQRNYHLKIHMVKYEQIEVP